MDIISLWISLFVSLIVPVFVFTLFITMIVLLAVVLVRKRTPSAIAPKTEAGDPRLVRIIQRKTIGGVCAGFAYKFGTPSWIVQVLWVVLTIGLPGIPFIAYIVLWIMMPKASEFPGDYDTRTENF